MRGYKRATRAIRAHSQSLSKRASPMRGARRACQTIGSPASSTHDERVQRPLQLTRALLWHTRTTAPHHSGSRGCPNHGQLRPKLPTTYIKSGPNPFSSAPRPCPFCSLLRPHRPPHRVISSRSHLFLPSVSPPAITHTQDRVLPPPTTVSSEGMDPTQSIAAGSHCRTPFTNAVAVPNVPPFERDLGAKLI